jgi:Protein of unknown function (DUF2510)
MLEVGADSADWPYPPEMSENPPVPPLPAGWYPTAGPDGAQRYWDGAAWTGHVARPTPTAPVMGNGFSTAALVLGILGFLGMGIPFFIGWFVGGPLDMLALIFGIVGAVKSGERGGAGRVPAVVAIVLAGVSLLSVFAGAGSIW